METVAVEVAPQRRNDVIDIGTDHIAKLAVGARVSGNGVDRPLRRAGDERQNLKAVPAEHALGRRQARLAPVAVDARPVRAAVALDAGEKLPHRLRQRRPPFRHQDRAARIGDGGERLRQHDAGIGDQAAPIAGMMRARAQFDDQIDRIAAARAEENRRLVRRDARAVGADQHVGLEQIVAVPRAQFAQARRADFLRHLDQYLAVEAERAAFLQHGGKGGNVDAVLAFVVGGAAAIDALAFDDDPPRLKARPPQLVLAGDGVAMAIDQHGDESRILDALGDQRRRPARIVEDAADKSERGERRHDLIVEISTERAGARRFLAGAGNGDAPAQRGKETAVVEKGVGPGDGAAAAHHATPIMRS